MKKFLLLVWGLLLCPQIVWGQASLIATSLSPGTVLAQPPARITLAFNEPVSVTLVQLIDPQGRKLPAHAVRDGATEIHIPVPVGTTQGTYLLSWRVVSADGQPVGGTLDYAVGAPNAQNSATEPPSQGLRDGLIWLARWLGYLCLFATVGGALFRILNPTDRQGWARPFLITGLALIPVDLVLQGLELQDAGWAGLIAPSVWGAALASRYAWTLGLMVLALLAAGRAMNAQGAGATRIAALTSLILAGLALAAGGHAGTADPQWLARPAVTLHVMMAIFWIGALIPLARSLNRHRTAHSAGGASAARSTSTPSGSRAQTAAASLSAAEPLARFSAWIVSAVLLLAGTGLVLTGLQVDRLSDLWQTDYGQLLLAKLALVVLLLLLATGNRWRLTRPALAGSAAAQQRLQRGIWLEVVVGVLILVAVSLWRFTPPPRSLDAAAGAYQGRMQHLNFPKSLENSQVRALLAPAGRHGNVWSIRLETPAGKPFKAQAVTLNLSNPSEGIEPLSRQANRRKDSDWLIGLPPLPDTGQWQVTLDVLVDDFDQITLDGPPAASSTARMANPVDSGH
ncbi:MAG: copper resistance protein CopC/CopD [Castellaniella sp.]|nr:copper resistance protein CopC/CopD [Castellaniella sp.]